MKKTILLITTAIFFLGTVQAFSLSSQQERRVLRDLNSNNYRTANRAIIKVKYKRLKNRRNIRIAHRRLRSLIRNRRKPANIRMAAARAVAYLKMRRAKSTLRYAIKRERNSRVKRSFKRALRRLGGRKYSSRRSDRTIMRDLRSNNARIAIKAIRDVKYNRMKSYSYKRRAKRYLTSIIRNRRKNRRIRREAAYAVAHLNYKPAKSALHYAMRRERNRSLKRSFKYAYNKLTTGSYSGKKRYRGTRSYRGTLRYSGTRGYGGTPR